jgi:hypothetical protein
MPDIQSKKDLINEIHNLLDNPNQPLAPILRRAITLADLCNKEEYKVLFDAHLDGINLKEEGRIEKWKDKNKTLAWYPTDAFLADRKVSDGKSISLPIEEVENSLKNTTEIKDKLIAHNKYKESKSVVAQELDFRLILTKVRNRIALFLREVEKMDEKPLSEDNNISETSPTYEWVKRNAWVFGSIFFFICFALSAMWFFRDRDFEPALAMLGSLIPFIAIIFNKGIKGLIFIIGFILGIILAASLFYLFPDTKKNTPEINNSSVTEKSGLLNPIQEAVKQSNEITDFRVTKDKDRTLNIEAWYFYTGDLGLENVTLKNG